MNYIGMLHVFVCYPLYTFLQIIRSSIDNVGFIVLNPKYYAAFG